MSFSDTESVPGAAKALDAHDQRKRDLITIAREYRNDPVVENALREQFPAYGIAAVPETMPDPVLSYEELAAHLEAIDSGLDTYAVEREKTRLTTKQAITIGRQALMWDHWGHVTKLARARIRNNSRVDITDFAQDTVAAFNSVIANFKRKDPKNFRAYLTQSAVNIMTSNIRKQYRTPEVPMSEDLDIISDETDDLRLVESAQHTHELAELLRNSKLSPSDITLLCLRFGIDPRSLNLRDILGEKHDEIMSHMEDKGYDAKSVATITGRKSAGAVRVAQHGIIRAVRAANHIRTK